MKNDRPSGTARLIARSLVLLSFNPALTGIVSPQAVEASLCFLAAGGEDTERFRRLAGRRWFQAILGFIERRTLPGILIHYALRKRCIEEAVRRSLEAGTAQVVVLGAGFDTLALRLHTEYPQTAFWEIDHPATQQVKQRALAAWDQPGDNLRLVPQDLAAGNMKDALASQPAFRPERDTFFVAEGLLMYLKSETVTGIFRDIRECSGNGSQFAFTFLEPQPDGRVNFARSSQFIDRWLRLRGETFQWGLKQDEAAAYLHAQGYILREIVTPEQLRQRFLSGNNPVASPAGDLIGITDLAQEQ